MAVSGDRRKVEPARLALTADALCEAYASRVFKFAQMVSDDSTSAEDLAQDALERAIRGLPTFDPGKGEVEAWLWRIVLNASRDVGRIARRQRLVFSYLIDRWLMDERAVPLDELTTADVIAAVRRLSPRHRAVVALRYGADLTFPQVGRALGISEAAATMASRRALAILRNRLSQRTDER